MIQLRNRNANIATPRPNWSDPVGVEYSWRTSIFTSRDGTEKRESIRQRPRIALKFTTAMNRALLSRHQQDMVENQNALWAVRAEWAWTRVSVLHSYPEVTFELEDAAKWLVPGQQIILDTATDEDLFTIATVDENTITVSDVTTKDYPVGTKVYLAYYCRAAASSNFTALTSRAWTGAVRYEVNPGEGEKVPTIPVPFIFGYAPMMLKKPNWRDSPSINFVQERDVFDPGFGLINVTAPWAAGRVQTQFGFTGLTEAESDDLVQFFNAMQGRRNSFWVPTWQDDIQPSDDQIGSAKVIKIEGEDFRGAYEDDPVFKSVIAFYDDCTYQANTIASIGGTTDSEVTFENDWSQEINSRTRMYWLVKARFDTDTLDVRWMTDETCEVQYSLVTLPHDKTTDWPVPAGLVSLATDDDLELQHWQDMEVKQKTPTSISELVDLYELGITQEMIDAGDVRVMARYAGSYQEGTPLADDDTTFYLDILFHDDYPVTWNSSTVTKVGSDVITFTEVQGPVVDVELGPVTVPPTARYVSFRAAYNTAVTSSLVLTESTLGVARPTTGSFAGTNLC